MTEPALARHDGLAQAEAVARGEVTITDLFAACLRRIEQLNPLLNAVTAIARQAPADVPHGALYGVPFLVKDVLPWSGLRWSMGSRLFAHNLARRETPLGKCLERAGLVCVGKAAMSEFGLLASTETVLEGVTHNPWDLACSPAGSSGGSAVAVAAGLVPLAYANDGGGSIRMPASACGVFGFKPSRGRTVSPGFSSSDLLELTSDGCLSRSVRDSAAFLAAIEEPAGRFASMGFVNAPLSRPLRVATWTGTLWGSEAEPSVLRAHAECIALLRSLGHSVEPIASPSFEPRLGAVLLLIAGAAAQGIVAAQDRARQEPVQRSELEPFTWDLIDDFLAGGQPALEDARAALRVAARVYRDSSAGFDIVLTPTLAREPWPIGYLSPVLARGVLAARTSECIAYTPIQNIVGAPAMSVPLQHSARGLPIGMHFAAAPGNDALLLQLAYQLEQACPWAERWPPYSIPVLAERA